jgi:mRNA interferase RelE/StbE
VYEVLLSSQAQRDLRRLPPEVFERVVAAVQVLGRTPRPPGCRKIVGSRSDWRLRVGEYRVVYEVDDRARKVRVMYVRHRRDAYR